MIIRWTMLCRLFSTANLHDHQRAAAVDVVNLVLAFEGQKQCVYVASSTQGQLLGAKAWHGPTSPLFGASRLARGHLLAQNRESYPNKP